MKRLLAILLALTVLLSLAGCRSRNNGDNPGESTTATIPIDREGKVVGISLPEVSWESTGRSLQTRLEVLGYKTVLQYAEGSAQTQSQQLLDMADQSVDCIVVAAVDAITLAETANDVDAAGIPIIAYDRLLTDTNAVTYYLAPNYNAMGKAIGQRVISDYDLDGPAQGGKSYTFEMFMGNPADTNSVLFYNGIFSVLQPYITAGVLRNLSGRMDFEDVCVADGTAETADALCTGRISNYYKDTELDICITGTDTIANGIISALEHCGYNREDWPMTTGMGYSDATLADGKLTLSVYTPKDQLSRACASLVDAAIFDIPPQLKGELTTTFNNSTSVPTYLCSYQLADTPAQEPEEDTSIEEPASPTEDTVSTESSCPVATS